MSKKRSIHFCWLRLAVHKGVKMSNNYLILVINLGSTSTKVALFDGEKELSFETIDHPLQEILAVSSDAENLDLRKKAVDNYLKKNNIKVSQLTAIAARGGVIGELESGAYLIDENFVQACKKPIAAHVSNLTPIIAYELAAEEGVKSYTYDMVCGCGRPEEIYMLSGMPELRRQFLTHVLNTRAVCFEQAKRDGQEIQDTNYIVTHMGGGITTNLISRGKIKDIVADDEGTFSPERAGGVPCRQLVKLCFSGKYSESEIQALLKGKGGLLAYLGTNDMREVEKRINTGDERALTVFQAMVLQIAKDIGSLAAVAEGKIDKIILTGGMAHSEYFTDSISRKVSFLAPVSIMAGTFEMQALALGVLRALSGQEATNRLQKRS